MSEYQAPLQDMQFVLCELVNIDEMSNLAGFEDVSAELAGAILEEAAKFASGVLSPLYQSGDREGATLRDGVVITAAGWREAYRQYCEAGWSGLALPTEFGGQGLPMVISTAVSEMWKSANIAFALCPMLTQGAINALVSRGSQSLRDKYLSRMVSGEWTGTMNLTEPQAGSDLAAVLSRAEPVGDGSYRIFGQKIFITYGEHDLAENIIHLVLARLPDSPKGVKGISLFVVPKFLVEENGELGQRNDVHCIGVEHKLGIHASPTCTLSYGENGGAIGHLVGEPNRGLEVMFIMMNEARFSVGLEGLALAERATQQAMKFSVERVQGFDVGERDGPRIQIIGHPDVKRMLLLMRSQTEAMRALAGVVAAAMDRADRSGDKNERAQAQSFVDLMIPIVKGWCTETGIEIATLGVQVHGGMGYIEETGAAQILRDARITTIYEGTTAIQANDLIGRKIARDGGAAVRNLVAEISALVAELVASDDETLRNIAHELSNGADAIEQACTYIVTHWASDIRVAHAAAVPLLRLFGTVCGGWQMARAALIAQQRLASGADNTAFLRKKVSTAHFYAAQVLPQSKSWLAAVLSAHTCLAVDAWPTN